MNTFSEPAVRLREAQKRATQDRVLEAARRHFEAHGFQAASLRAIALEAGVAPGTVLLHFTDKLGLLHAALHHDLESAMRASLAAPRRGRLQARLSAVVRPFFAYYAARPGLSRVLLAESLLAEPPWRERFADQLARVAARVAELVEQAKAGGELSRETHTPTFVAAFSAFYYFVLVGWVQGRVDDPLASFEALVGQHISGAR